MAIYSDRAIVLRTWKLGESDRIAAMLTETLGKVRVVAKGARKPRSRFGGRIEPTRHLHVQCYEGRQLDNLTQVESIDGFRAVREDLDRLTKAAVLLEATDQLSTERQPDPGAYRMLLGALRRLEESDSAMLVPSFLLKRLAHEGLGPQLDVCVVSGETADLVAFDVELGGVVSAQVQRGRYVEPGSLQLMRRVMGGELAQVLDEPESACTHEVADVVTRLYEHHVERRLRSVRAMDAS
jgi:DNA repair protein RecO (recombination protein O)